MLPTPAKLAHLADLNRSQTTTVRQVHNAMGALRAARLQLRQAQRVIPGGITLEGRPAAERIDQVAELLHHYTAQLRRQADALTTDD